MQQITVDTNVIRDYLEAGRPRHGLAREIFRLAQAGIIQLAVAPQGHRLDVKDPLRRQLEACMRRESVKATRQVARVSQETYPSHDLLPGNYIEGLQEAWHEIIADWRTDERKPPGQKDLWHVEAHLCAKRDIFVTSDEALLTMCNRLTREKGIRVDALSPSEYLSQREERELEDDNAARSSQP